MPWRDSGYISSESDPDLGGDLDLAEQYGTPKTRKGMLKKPSKQAPWAMQHRSSRSLKSSKSKESLQRKQSQEKVKHERMLNIEISNMKFVKNLSKKQMQKGSDAAKRQKQDARIYKELTTTFQVLGIDALLLKEDITATPHIPFTNTTSCRTSTFVSETNSEASMISGSTSISCMTNRTRMRSRGTAMTSIDACDGGERFFSEGAKQLIDEYSAEFGGDIPEKVKVAEEVAAVALDQLEALNDFSGCSYEHHSEWVSCIEYCRTIAQDVAQEMRFSMPVPISGSLETSPSMTDEGERITAVLGVKIQELHEAIHEQAIKCAERLAPCFNTQHESSLKQVFESTGKLIRSCQLLLEQEARLEDSGIGHFFLRMPPNSMENVQHALLELLCAATTATEKFQTALLVPDNLRQHPDGSGKSAHELSEASRVLVASWGGCYELVAALARPAGRGRTAALQNSMHKLKYKALHQFAATLIMAAACASEMQQPFQAERKITPNPNVWKRSATTTSSGVINDGVVQAHLWLVNCISELLKLANIAAKQLRAHAKGHASDDGTSDVLEGLRHSFCHLTMTSTRRMSWLLSKPESVARWALESLEDQGSQTLYHVKKYDQGALAFDDDYLSSNEGIKKYRALRESTDQLTNAIFDVRTKLQLRRASDEPSIMRNPSIVASKTNSNAGASRPGSAQKGNSTSGSSFSSHGHVDGARKPLLHKKPVGNSVQSRGSLLTKAVRNGAQSSSGFDVSSPMESIIKKQALSRVNGRSERVQMLDKGVEGGPQKQPSPGRGQVKVRSRGIEIAGGMPIGHQNSVRNKPVEDTDLGDRRCSNSRDMDVFPMDMPKDGPVEEANPGIVKFRSPFDMTALQKATMQGIAPPVLEKSSSKTDILKSPFARGFPQSPSLRKHCPKDSNGPTSSSHQPLIGSWTSQMNNSLSEATTSKFTPKMSYRDAAKAGLGGEVVSSKDKLPSSPTSTPREVASSRTNAETMEILMETKISSHMLRTSTTPDLEESSQRGSSRVPCESEKAPENTGLPMGQMDDMSKIQKGDLVIRSKLGAGASGQVYECSYQGAPCAVKVLNRPADLSAKAEFAREMEMHQNLQYHPNVVRFFGECKNFIQVGEQAGSGLVMELCALGSVLNLITEARYCRNLFERKMLLQEHKQNPGYLLWCNWKKRLKLAKDVACGLRYLHSHGIIHRDLTSYNVVVHLSWEAKVCDFARSKVAPKDRLIDRSDTIANSPAWSAPEIVAGRPYSTQADVFSLGVVLWELVTLERPWEEQLFDAKYFDWAVINQVKAGNTLRLPGEVYPPLPEWTEVRELIGDCFKIDPLDRPTTADVHKRLEEINERVEKRLRQPK